MLGNDIVEGCSAPGQGALTTSGPPPGRVGFVQAFGNGVKCYYSIFDGTQTEKGWTTTGSQLARNVIWTSVNGLSSTPLNFTGTCQVYCTLPAQRALWADDSSVYQAQGRRLNGIGDATELTDAPARHQVGLLRTQSIGVQNGVILLPFPRIPAGAAAHTVQVDLRAIQAAGNAPYYFRLSMDGGSSFLAGAGEYRFSLFTAGDGSSAESNGFISYAPFTAALEGVSALSGSLDFDTNTRQWSGRTVGVSATTGRYSQSLSAGNSVTVGTPTHILISAVGFNLTGGMARISQKVF